MVGSWNSDDESSCESDISYSTCSSEYNSDIDDDEQDIHAMAADQASHPCFKLANKGHCDGMNNGKCTYCHNTDVIFKARCNHRKWWAN